MKTLRYGLVGVALVAGAQPGGVNFYSAEKEMEIGAQQARSMAVTPLNNPAAAAYVDRIVAELARQIADPKLPFIVKLVNEPVGVEPAVLMGGYIFISVGIFQAARDENEFVGILAHAMARAADRDASRKASRQQLFEIAIMPLQGRAGMQPPFDSFARQCETQADSLAVKALAAAGYSPAGLAAFVERNARDDHALGWQQFQADRLAKLRDAAAQVGVSPRAAGDDFARVRDAIGK